MSLLGFVATKNVTDAPTPISFSGICGPGDDEDDEDEDDDIGDGEEEDEEEEDEEDDMIECEPPDYGD